MALLFMDSFDHYVTADLTTKWTNIANSPAISAGNGRRSSASARLGTSGLLQKGLASISGATAIVGVACRLSSLTANARCVGIHDGLNNRDHVYLTVNADGSITAFRGGLTGPNAGGGTALGTSAVAVITANTFAYVELRVLIHASAGTLVVRVNNTVVLNLTAQNTSNGVSVVWNTFWLGMGASINCDFDDLYVLDGSGSAPWNDFLGDCRVDALYPTAAGATTGWTPSAGTNWQCIDETAPNGDTDFTSATTIGLTDTFVVPDSPVAGSVIYGVQHCVSVKKMDAGAALIAPVVRHSGADFVGADISPGTTYAYGVQVAAVNPGTGAAWTEAGFNAAEFGYRKTG